MRHVLIALVIGSACALATFVMPHSIRLNRVEIGDIGPPLAGMAIFLRGGSPYDVRIAAGDLSKYPFTAMLVLAPFLLVPLRLVAPLFCGLSAGLLGYGVLREGRQWRLLLFLSAPFVASLHSVQWAPLLTAALLLPALLVFASVKPQVGLVLLAAGKWSRTAILGALLLVLLAFAVDPAWLREWLDHLSGEKYYGGLPILIGPGIVLLASALAWRVREARLLLAQSVAMQRYFYDQLPMLMIPQSARQMMLLVAVSWIAPATSIGLHWWDPASGRQDARTWVLYVSTFHLLALAMLLRNAYRGGLLPRRLMGRQSPRVLVP